MADLEKLRANLEARGFRTAYFPTADEAAAYLDGQIDGKTVGIGGSMTVKEMGLTPGWLPTTRWSGTGRGAP